MRDDGIHTVVAALAGLDRDDFSGATLAGIQPQSRVV